MRIERKTLIDSLTSLEKTTSARYDDAQGIKEGASWGFAFLASPDVYKRQEEDRERIMNEERRLFCNSVSKASKRLVAVSYTHLHDGSDAMR